MQLLATWLVAFQAIRPYSERNLIGRRTESDRTADGIRSGGGRNPKESVMPSRECFQGVHLSQVHQPSNIDAPLVLLV